VPLKGRGESVTINNVLWPTDLHLQSLDDALPSAYNHGTD
jgi:hypothetical protein